MWDIKEATVKQMELSEFETVSSTRVMQIRLKIEKNKMFGNKAERFHWSRTNDEEDRRLFYVEIYIDRTVKN